MYISQFFFVKPVHETLSIQFLHLLDHMAKTWITEMKMQTLQAFGQDMIKITAERIDTGLNNCSPETCLVTYKQ